MSRFVVENPPLDFTLLTPGYEKDYVKQLERCGERLFPAFYLRQWSPVIRDRNGFGAQPDMVLVSRELDSWYVVEVELASHSVPGHIGPQLDTLSQGVYDLSLVDTLQRVLPEFTEAQLRGLLCREPGFLCIINTYMDSVQTICRETHFDLAVVEPFSCFTGQWAVSVRQMPRMLQANQMAVGKYQLRRRKTLGDKTFFELPGQFPPWNGSVGVVTLDGQESKCQLIAGSPRTILLPTTWVPERCAARLIVLDPQRQVLRLEVE